jgi:DNA polymerase III alpha subunit
MVCTVVTYRARSAVREVAKALGFPPEGVDALAKALDTRDASDVARDLALDGSFAWLFDELGISMASAAVPPGRDGRGHRTDASAPSRPVSEGGWSPPRKPRVLDASVTSVRFEATQTKRYAGSGTLPLPPDQLPMPRDTGSPGPASERRSVVRVDEESGMPIEERRRPSVLDRGASTGEPGQIPTRIGLGGDATATDALKDPETSVNLNLRAGSNAEQLDASDSNVPKPSVVGIWQGSGRASPATEAEPRQMLTTGALGERPPAIDAANLYLRPSTASTHLSNAHHAGIWQESTPTPLPNAHHASIWQESAPERGTHPATHAPPRNRWQWLLKLCGEIDGFPRHLGIHVGGMLVTRTPIVDLVPIERASMPNRVVTQYDKEDVEQLGLVKIDLLSLRTLGVVSDALDRIQRDTQTRPDLDNLPHDDPEVFAIIRAADTVGIFQIESRAQMQALPKARPERFEDLVVQVAIIRPGPIQGNAVHPYLRRRAGTEPVTYLHESLRPILEDTLGVILYQEQVMQIAIEVCGYSALDADIFRKAMGSHRSRREMEKQHARFVEGAQRTGLTPEAAEELFQRCSAFAEFGFARAHAAAFAKITYDTAWLRLHYPAHYYAGMLNNQPMGVYSPAVVINDAKRHGVQVLPVDVNASAWEHDTRPIPPDAPSAPSFAPDATNGQVAADLASPMVASCFPGKPRPSSGPSMADSCTSRKSRGTTGYALRLGLRQVKGIDERAREVLERERARGPYVSVRDFVARTRLGEQVVERLISIGAFDWTGAPRRELLWQLRSTLADANADRPALGLTDDAQRALGASLPEMTDAERVAADYRETGVSPHLHAVELYRSALTERGVIRIAETGRRRNRSVVRLAGLAVSVQHPMTAKNFVFIALEDESGMINVTVRPDIYQRHRALLHRSPLLVIDGTLQVEGEVLNVVARRLRSVDEVVNQSRVATADLARQQRMFR